MSDDLVVVAVPPDCLVVVWKLFTITAAEGSTPNSSKAFMLTEYSPLIRLMSVSPVDMSLMTTSSSLNIFVQFLSVKPYLYIHDVLVCFMCLLIVRIK